MATGVAEREQRTSVAAPRPDPAQLVRAAAPAGPLERRICTAALRLVGRWGVRKTTIADVAKEAGCGRATVYRAYPGGKRDLLLAAAAHDLASFLDDLGALADRAPDTESVLVALICNASQTLVQHHALQFVLHHEPDLLLPYLGWAEQNTLYGHISLAIGPHLAPFVGEQAGWAAEWLARTVLSYLFNPSPEVDLTDAATCRRVIRHYLLPALESAPLTEPSA